LFGPNSIEIEDVYLRLDLDLAAFFSILDERVGKGNYLLFLTADHGAAHAVGYSKKNRMPADFFSSAAELEKMNQMIQQKFGISHAIRSAQNYQINFDLPKISAAHADFDSIKKFTTDYLQTLPGVNYAIDMDKVGECPVPEPIKKMIVNGYHFKRSGQVQVIFEPGWLDEYSRTGTSHGVWNAYDTHIPLIFMGWDIHPGATATRVQMTDIAPTLATLLHIQAPDGNIGTPIVDLLVR
jgi:arylsulfatase A-like enzyme